MWAAAANGELSGDNMSEFVIHNPQNVSTKVNIVQTTLGSNAQEWTVLESLTQLDPGENNFKFQPPNNLLATMYIEYEDGELYIYLGSYS